MFTFSPLLLSPTRILSRKLSEPGRGMLIAIDAGVEHGDALAAGAISGARVLMLDPHQDAIAQITQAIHRPVSRYQSVHIVTHGSPGCLHFSSGDLTLSNLHQYAEPIESWFRYQPIQPGSDVMVKDPDWFLALYACNLAEGEIGREFLANLHYLAGVSLHASCGKVGSSALDGSWQLEVAYPFAHKARFPFTEDLLETYEGVLRTPSEFPGDKSCRPAATRR